MNVFRRATMTSDVEALIMSSWETCVNLTTGPRKPGLKILFLTLKDTILKELQNQASFFRTGSWRLGNRLKGKFPKTKKKWESAIVGMKVFSTRQCERRSDTGRCVSQTWSILMTPKLAFMAPEKLCLARTGCSNSIAPRCHLVKKR